MLPGAWSAPGGGPLLPACNQRDIRTATAANQADPHDTGRKGIGHDAETRTRYRGYRGRHLRMRRNPGQRGPARCRPAHPAATGSAAIAHPAATHAVTARPSPSSSASSDPSLTWLESAGGQEQVTFNDDVSTLAGDLETEEQSPTVANHVVFEADARVVRSE